MKKNAIQIVSSSFLEFMKDFFNHSIQDILINEIDDARKTGNVEAYQYLYDVVFEIGNGLVLSLSNGSSYRFGVGYSNNQYVVELCKLDNENALKDYVPVKESKYYNSLSNMIGKQIKSIKPEIQLTFNESPLLRSIKFYSEVGVEFAVLGEDYFQTSREKDLPIFDGCWIIFDKAIIELI